MRIRRLETEDIKMLKLFPPEEWNFDFEKFLIRHLYRDYFEGILLVDDDQIIGVGNLICNEKVCWICNIIVNPDFRKKGYGSLITAELIKIAKQKQIEVIILVATKLGEPVYSKQGFRNSSYYHFYEGCEKFIDELDETNFHRITSELMDDILNLDYRVTGEKRKNFLLQFAESGYLYKVKGNISGYFLPELGSGLIIATDESAGLQLLEFRRKMLNINSIVIPSENHFLIGVMSKLNFTLKMSLPRMVLGSELNWNQNCIFNRGSGYSG